MAADCTQSADFYPVVVVGGGWVSDGAGGAVSVVGGVVLDAGGGASPEVLVVSFVAVFAGSLFAMTGGLGFRRGGFAGYPVNGPLLLGIDNVPAIVPGCVCAVVVVTWGSVKFVVVSAFVPVMPALGGVASPGAVIVEVTAEDDWPS